MNPETPTNQEKDWIQRNKKHVENRMNKTNTQNRVGRVFRRAEWKILKTKAAYTRKRRKIEGKQNTTTPTI